MKAWTVPGREEEVQTLYDCMAGLLWEGVEKGMPGVKGKEEEMWADCREGTWQDWACWSSEL